MVKVYKKTDIERDIAALRHMEKIKGELRGGKRLITPNVFFAANAAENAHLAR
jgi:hypothetical protein